LETNSPYKAEIESTLEQKSGAAPLVMEHGTLSIIKTMFPV